jgi:ElaB/YqjD/DUF883 family membrane-anchored ribosome-binding protein
MAPGIQQSARPVWRIFPIVLSSLIDEVNTMATQIDPQVKETIHARTQAAAEAAHNLVDRVAKRAEVSEEKLRGSALQAQRSMRTSLQDARERSLIAKDSVTEFMRRHPVAAVGIAFGIGALLAARSASRRAAAEVEAPETDTRVH